MSRDMISPECLADPGLIDRPEPATLSAVRTDVRQRFFVPKLLRYRAKFSIHIFVVTSGF